LIYLFFFTESSSSSSSKSVIQNTYIPHLTSLVKKNKKKKLIWLKTIVRANLSIFAFFFGEKNAIFFSKTKKKTVKFGDNPDKTQLIFRIFMIFLE